MVERSQFSRSQNIPAIIRRRKISLIIPFIIVLLIATAFALLWPSVFKSSATILIEEQEIPPDLVMTMVTSYAEQRLQTINQRIMSTTRLLEIMNRFNLYAGIRETKTREEIIEQMRKDIKLDFINADVIDRRTGRPSSVAIAFTLSFASKESPITVRDVTSVLASLFLEENIKVRERQVTEASQFFQVEMERVKADLDRLDGQISNYKEQHLNELPELLPANYQSLNEIQLKIERLHEEGRNIRERQSYLESELVTIDPYRIEQQRLEEMRFDLTRLEAKYSESYPDIARLKQEISELEAKGMDKKTDGTGKASLPDNPVYLQKTAQLAGIKSDIQSNEKQIRDLGGQAELFRQRIASSPAVEGAYKALLGERSSMERKYQDLTTKFMEAKVAQGLEKDQKGERFTIIDAATTPEKPFKPNRLVIMLIGLVIALGAGVTGASLREFADKTIHNPEDLGIASDLPFLAAIPVIVTAREAVFRKRRQYLTASITACFFAASITAFHYAVMDLNILLLKIIRRLSS